MSPETVRGYLQREQAHATDSKFGAKMRQLIALAVAITLCCDGCIAVHTAEAKKAGPTRDELAELLVVAISVNAGAAIVYITRTFDAFETA